MNTYFERFMALRYLRGVEGRAEGRTFIRFITYVSIGGVTVGVAALLLALSIVRGFSQEIRAKITGVGAHVQVRSYLQDTPLENAGRLQRQLAALPHVQEARPIVEGFALLRQSERAIDGVALVGVDAPPPYLAGRITAGRFALDTDTTRQQGLVVGAALAERLGVHVGSRVTLFSMQGGESARLTQPRVRQFRVTGIYETALANIDDLYVFTGLGAARDLLDVSSSAVSRVDLRLDDVSRADSVAARIEDSMGAPVSARTIFQQYRGLFAWVDLQENIIPLVIGVIIVVAAFNIVGTLLMLILEKTREIGVLQSLGASGRTVKRLFLALGVLIGAVGTVFGEGIALGLALIQQQYEIIPLPAQAYYLSSAPVAINGADFLLVAGVTLTLCAAAAYIPARVAARVEPVRAIRFQ
jgi:lipoprotein-releasing system permease protein